MHRTYDFAIIMAFPTTETVRVYSSPAENACIHPRAKALLAWNLGRISQSSSSRTLSLCRPLYIGVRVWCFALVLTPYECTVDDVGRVSLHLSFRWTDDDACMHIWQLPICQKLTCCSSSEVENTCTGACRKHTLGMQGWWHGPTDRELSMPM
jgi:hypothetical protein